MRLSVIINTLNRPATLKQTLEHLALQEADGAWEVIIIDDGGDIDLRPLAAQFASRLEVRLHHIPHSGCSVARNIGARMARSERLWFLGDDVLASPGCWAVHAGEPDPATAVLGPYVQPRHQLSPTLHYYADANHFEFIEDAEHTGFFFFLTGNISLGRSALEAVGGFDPAYHPYAWEDIDLGVMLELAGGRVRCEARAHAVHAHPNVTRRGLWQREYWVGYTGRRFYEKWKHLGPHRLAPTRFWPDDPEHATGSGPLRHLLGQALVGVTDTFFSMSRINARLMKRMVYASRLRGFIAGNNPVNLRGVRAT